MRFPKDLLFTILIIVLLSLPNYVLASNQTYEINFDYAAIFSKFNLENVMCHVKNLSSFTSRYTSYPGCKAAAQYIYSMLQSYGLDKVWLHTYYCTVYVDRGANLTTVDGMHIPLYPLLPNAISPVTTGPEGVSGRLVYVGSGNLEDLNGKDINGSIIVMDFNSGYRWLDVAKLGANAVIFLEPDITIRNEAEQKRLYFVPFKFPRFYLERKYFNQILDLEDKAVTIYSMCSWENRESENILAYVLGKKYPQYAILITSYFDSDSIVPSLAPGASEILGTALALEMARLFAEERPDLTVMFAFFSGYHQGLVGAREWVEDQLFRDYSALGFDFLLNIDVDISTDSDIIVPQWSGGFWALDMITSRIVGFSKNAPHSVFKESILKIIRQAEAQIGFKYWLEDSKFRFLVGGDGGLRAPEISFYKWRISEAIMTTSIPALSLNTFYSWRPYFRTPFDMYEKIDTNKLKPQAAVIYSIIYSFANSDWLLYMSRPIAEFPPKPKKHDFWAVDVIGHVVTWNESISWYTPVSKAIVMGIRHYAGTGDVGLGNPSKYPLFIVLTDDNGTFIVHDITSYALEKAPGPSTAQGHGEYSLSFIAYKLDDYGNIIYGPDQGRYKLPPLTRWKVNNEFYIAVFECSSMVIFDLFDPQLVDTDPLYPTYLTISDIRTHTSLIHVGYQIEYAPYGYYVGVIYIPPEVPVEILIQNAYATRYPLAILTNASQINMRGNGYSIARGKQFVVTNTPLEYAKDLYWLAKSREEILKKSGLSSTSEELENSVKEWIEKSYESIKAKNHSSLIAYSYNAWEVARRYYLKVTNLRDDAIYVIPIFAFLIVPFAFFFDRIAFNTSGYKKAITLVCSYAIALIPLIIFHPGFSLAANPIMILIGSIILVLSLPIIVLFINRAISMLKDLRLKTFGAHELKREKMSLLINALSYGIGHYKRRKFRASLMLLSLMLIEFSLVSFMSLAPLETIIPIEVPLSAEGIREGILVRRPDYGPTKTVGVGLNAFRRIKYTYGEDFIVVPRIWLWPNFRPDIPEISFLLEKKGRHYEILGLIGLSKEEYLVTKINTALIEGTWFFRDYAWEVILPQKAAKNLEAKIGDIVYFMGIPFRVVGIFNEEAYYSLIDIDGWPLSPADLSRAGSIPLDPDKIILLPYETCMRMAQVLYQPTRWSSFIASIGISSFKIDEKDYSMISKKILTEY
ncbi:MAG: M28 family peptidase, partial [Candidatus Bathyarchaeia archaeon]